VLEHQSQSIRLMAYRLMKYVVRILERQFDPDTHESIPLVLPLVVRLNAVATHWIADRDSAERLDRPRNPAYPARVSRAELFFRDDGVALASVGPVWVMLLTGTPTEARMLRVEPTFAAMKAAYPDGFATLTWALPSVGMMMDGGARQAVATITKVYAGDMLSRANVVEGDGFWAATARAVLSGLTLLSSVTTPQRTFTATGDAVAWLIEATPKLVFPPRAELEAELDRLRAGQLSA